MKILVFIKEGRDVSVPLVYDEHSRGVRKEGGVPQLDPSDCATLETALKIKALFSETHISLIHFGPASGEEWLRQGLSLGCDDVLRIWEHGLDEVHSPGKALILARVAEILGFDLILTGSRSRDTGSGQVGIRMAVHLNIPSVVSVIELAMDRSDRSARLKKNLARGFQEEVRCPLPLLATVEGSGDVKRYASLPDILGAWEKEISCWDLAQIGLPWESIREKDSLLNFGPISFPKPRLKKISAPESSLPTFERILKLLEGKIRQREGKIIKDDEDHMVEELFQALLKGGWLKPLQPLS